VASIYARWLPAFSMMLVSLISYIDRNTLALLAPTILKETHLSARDYGFIVSAFSVAYMIGNPVWGSLLDRLGLRRGMTAAVSLWTVASAAHAFATGFFSFAGARAALGFGEGATFPGGLRTVIQTLPPELRSRGTALAYSGGSLGAVITPIVVTPIALRYGWRGAFWFTGFVGLCWIAWWLRMSRRPDVAHVAPSEAPSAASRPRLRDPRIWSFTLLYSLGGLPIAFVLYGAALYLNQAFGKTQAEIGKVLWIPPLGWEIGYFFWGWVTDGFARPHAHRDGAAHGAEPAAGGHRAYRVLRARAGGVVSGDVRYRGLRDRGGGLCDEYLLHSQLRFPGRIGSGIVVGSGGAGDAVVRRSVRSPPL